MLKIVFACAFGFVATVSTASAATYDAAYLSFSSDKSVVIDNIVFTLEGGAQFSYDFDSPAATPLDSENYQLTAQTVGDAPTLTMSLDALVSDLVFQTYTVDIDGGESRILKVQDSNTHDLVFSLSGTGGEVLFTDVAFDVAVRDYDRTNLVSVQFGNDGTRETSALSVASGVNMELTKFGQTAKEFTVGSFDGLAPTPVPVPAALPLLGFALAGLGIMRRRSHTE